MNGSIFAKNATKQKLLLPCFCPVSVRVALLLLLFYYQCPSVLRNQLIEERSSSRAAVLCARLVVQSLPTFMAAWNDFCSNYLISSSPPSTIKPATEWNPTIVLNNRNKSFPITFIPICLEHVQSHQTRCPHSSGSAWVQRGKEGWRQVGDPVSKEVWADVTKLCQKCLLIPFS